MQKTRPLASFLSRVGAVGYCIASQFHLCRSSRRRCRNTTASTSFPYAPFPIPPQCRYFPDLNSKRWQRFDGCMGRRSSSLVDWKLLRMASSIGCRVSTVLPRTRSAILNASMTSGLVGLCCLFFVVGVFVSRRRPHQRRAQCIGRFVPDNLRNRGSELPAPLRQHGSTSFRPLRHPLRGNVGA